MKLFKYSDFKGLSMVNENLDQAKKVLRDTYQTFKSVKSVTKDYDTDPSGLFLFNKSGDIFRFEDLPDEVQNNARSKFRENALTPDEKQKVERNSVIKTIRDLLGDKNLGYAYLFTYLMIIEKTPVEELQSIFSKLQECRDLLSAKNTDGSPLIRRPINTYIDTSIKNNAEQLVDDLENISLYKSVKKIYAELTPELKQDFKDQPPVIKKQMEEIALALSQLGMDGGKMDENKQQKLWKLFFGEVKTLPNDTIIRGVSYKAGDKVYTGQMSRYKTVRDFIKSAQNFLKNIGNTETVQFYEQIEKCNDKYGDFGAKVMFDESNILILEILSFQANQMLNSHTRHCIKDSLYQWDSYIGGEDKNTKQYYIYNFNLPSYDTKSVIGITIAPDSSIRACHLKDDGYFSDKIKPLLKAWEREYSIKTDLWTCLPPMDKAEVERKRRRVLANREIVKKGLTLAQAKKLLTEDGADVNTGKGAALHNAVVEADVEKVKFLLEFGASTTMREKQEATVNAIQDIEDSEVAFEILKYLLRHGAELSRNVIKGLINDVKAVKFCLDNGFDPNFENGAAIRLALKRGNYDVIKLLTEAGAKTESSRGLDLAWAYEGGSEGCVEYVLSTVAPDVLKNSMSWIAHSPHIQPDSKKMEILLNLQKMIDSGKLKLDQEGYRIYKDGALFKRSGTYDELVAVDGNFAEHLIKRHNLRK